MTVRIHLGAHKTATTEMQLALGRLGAEMAAAGTGYLGPSRLRGQWVNLTDALLRRTRDDLWRTRRRLRRWLADHSHHVLSEENIIGTVHHPRIFGAGNRLYPDAVARVSQLLALMGNPPVQLFLSTRDPADFTTSAYGQALREGVPMGIADYIEGYDVPAFSWRDLAGRLLDCPGVVGLTCWRFEDYAALRPRVLSALIGEDLAMRVGPVQTRHMGISEAAYQQFMASLTEDMDTPFAELLRRACAAHPKRLGDVGIRPLPASVYAASRVAYQGDIAALRAMDRVTMLWPETGPSGTNDA